MNRKLFPNTKVYRHLLTIMLIVCCCLVPSFSFAQQTASAMPLSNSLNIAVAVKDSQLTGTAKPVNNQDVLQNFLNAYHAEIITFIILIICVGIITILYIIFIQRKSRRDLWELAYTDSLTGIRNIEKFKTDACEIITKYSEKNYAVMYFDIAQFKVINDMFGFEEGNKVLFSVVNALKEFGGYNLYARISNDNFIILTDSASRETLLAQTYMFSDIFYRIHFAENSKYSVTFKWGIYKIKSAEEEINSIIDKADTAHKRAKTIADHTVFYDSTLREIAIKTKEITDKMESALKKREFLVYMQPKYYLDSMQLAGAEALIRWQTAGGEIVLPKDFIPVFEKNGFIINIDDFVLDEVCNFQRMILDGGKTPVPISVNQSRLHLQNPNYVQNIIKIINSYNLQPNLIELELTETVIHDNIDTLVQITNELKNNGVSVSIDDFGSGYSSLNLLKDIHADIIKIDKGFLESLEENRRGHKILKNVIQLAKEINMSIVAEGVETKDQEKLLLNLQCHIVQGFLYAKPMPLEEFLKLL